MRINAAVKNAVSNIFEDKNVPTLPTILVNTQLQTKCDLIPMPTHRLMLNYLIICVDRFFKC